MLVLGTAVPFATALLFLAVVALSLFVFDFRRGPAAYRSYKDVRGAKIHRKRRPTRKKGRRPRARVENAAEMVNRSARPGRGGGSVTGIMSR